MGPIYKYGLENNKQSKKPLSFAFQTDAERMAANYEGTNVGDTAIEQSNMSENIINEAGSEAKAVKSVREGKLDRKKSFEEAKKIIRDKRDASLSELDKNKKDLNIDKIEASTGKPTGYDDSSNKKQIRTEKRRAMQDIRDKEKGQRRADKRNRGIERLENRNNMSNEDATKAYDTRTSTYAAYNVNAANQNSINALKQKENDNKNTLGDKILADPGSNLGKSSMSIDSASKVKANITSLDKTK